MLVRGIFPTGKLLNKDTYDKRMAKRNKVMPIGGKRKEPRIASGSIHGQK